MGITRFTYNWHSNSFQLHVIWHVVFHSCSAKRQKIIFPLPNTVAWYFIWLCFYPNIYCFHEYHKFVSYVNIYIYMLYICWWTGDRNIVLFQIIFLIIVVYFNMIIQFADTNVWCSFPVVISSVFYLNDHVFYVWQYMVGHSVKYITWYRSSCLGCW